MKRNKDKGFLGRLRNVFPASRTEAVKVAHAELIYAAESQVKKSAMLGCMHALEQKGKDRNPVEHDWWARQTLKWENVWAEINRAVLSLDEAGDIALLGVLAESTFRIYEQMAVDALTVLAPVSPEELKSEAKRWRNLCLHLAGLHRHCLLMKYQAAGSPPLPEKSKNTSKSGIKELKER